MDKYCNHFLRPFFCFTDVSSNEIPKVHFRSNSAESWVGALDSDRQKEASKRISRQDATLSIRKPNGKFWNFIFSKKSLYEVGWYNKKTVEVQFHGRAKGLCESKNICQLYIVFSCLNYLSL